MYFTLISYYRYTKTVGKIASTTNHVYLSETAATTNFVSVHTGNLTSAFMADIAALPESLNAFNGSTAAYTTFIRKVFVFYFHIHFSFFVFSS